MNGPKTYIHGPSIHPSIHTVYLANHLSYMLVLIYFMAFPLHHIAGPQKLLLVGFGAHKTWIPPWRWVVEQIETRSFPRSFFYFAYFVPHFLK